MRGQRDRPYGIMDSDIEKDVKGEIVYLNKYLDRIKNIANEYPWILMAPGAVVVAFMHLWKLTTIPNGYNVDEIGTAVDAWYLANFGVDRSGLSYPFYIPNYGFSQSPLYTYSLVILFKIFGKSKFVLRLVAALYAFLGCAFGCGFCRLKWKDNVHVYLWVYLFAILPVFTMETRYAFDSHLLMATTAATLYFGAKALKQDRVRDYILAGIAFGFCLHSYVLTFILVPIVLVLLLIYRIRMRRLEMSKILGFMIPLLIFMLPCVLFHLVNFGLIEPFRIGPVTFVGETRQAGSQFTFHHFWIGIYHFLFDTLLFDNIKYCTTPYFGTMFYFSIPFILIGLWKCTKETLRSFKERETDVSAMAVFWFIASLLLSCGMAGSVDPNSNRMTCIFPVYLYFLICGLGILRKLWIKILVGTLYAVAFASFAIYYFGFYGALGTVPSFEQDYACVRAYLEEHSDEPFARNKNIYPLVYPYYLWTYDIRPDEYVLDGAYIGSFGKDEVYNFDPKPLDIMANYVVRSYDIGQIQGIIGAGYTDVDLGDYHLMISPLAEFEEYVTDGCLLSIEQKDLDEGRHLILSGWSADITLGAAFTKYRLYIADEEPCDLDPIPREDVATALGDAVYENCGFQLTVPVGVEKYGSEGLRLYGVTETGEEKLLYELRHMKGAQE